MVVQVQELQEVPRDKIGLVETVGVSVENEISAEGPGSSQLPDADAGDSACSL